MDETAESGAHDAQTSDAPASGVPASDVPASARRTRIVAAVGSLAVLVLAAVVWSAVSERRAQQELAEAHESLAVHLEERAEVIAAAEGALARGAELHDASAGEVHDDSVRVHLASTLAALDNSLAQTREVATAPEGADVARVREVVALVAPAVAASALAVDETELAIAAVTDAQHEWTVAAARAQLDALLEELAGLAEEGAVLLARTEGAVLDESVREHLATVLGRAADRLAEPAAPDDHVPAAAEQVREIVASVAAAVAAVDESGAAWQVEHDRLAAERAAQAAQAGPRPSASAAPGGADGFRPAAQGPVAQPPAGAPAPAPAPAAAPVPEPVAPPVADPAPAESGSYWVETESGFGSDLCGDVDGNTWEC